MAQRSTGSGSEGSGGGAKAADGKAAEQRREQLLRAALDVIVSRGYADTRIADVAEHAGTSPALGGLGPAPGTGRPRPCRPGSSRTLCHPALAGSLSRWTTAR